MSNFSCKKCDKSFVSKQGLTYHEKKNVCSRVGKYICQWCDKSLSSSSSLYRHKKSCKNRNNCNDSDEEIDNGFELSENELKEFVPQDKMAEKIYQMLLKMQEENNELRVKVTRLENDPKVVNNTTNNNCNINNGTVNNYYLVGYGKEDMSKVDHSDLLKGMRLGFNSTLNLIDSVHFNPKYPEFHNVYISSMKNKYAMMYDGNAWTLVMKDDLIDKLYDDKRNYIEENLEEFVGSLTPSQVNALHRWMNADDTHPYISKIKNDIKLLLYNKRHMPLTNKNKKLDKQTIIEGDIPVVPSNDVKVIKQDKHVITKIFDLEGDTSSGDNRNDIVVVRSENKSRFQRTAPRNGTKRKNAKVRRRYLHMKN